MLVERLPGALQQERVADGEHGSPRPRFSPPRCTAVMSPLRPAGPDAFSPLSRARAHPWTHVLRSAQHCEEGHPMRRLFVTWAAIMLLGSGAATVHAQGYEKEPVLAAKDLVGPELLKGPHFTTD